MINNYIGTPISYRSELDMTIPSGEQSTTAQSPGSFNEKIKITREKVNSILKKRFYSERKLIYLLNSRKISNSSYLNVNSHLSS
jgi:hypothetical protein